MAWATTDDVREQWADAQLIDDPLLQKLIDAAHPVCETYAPSLGAGAPVPPNYVQAEILQVRSVYSAGQRDGDVLGFGDGFAVRVRPLGEDVKLLLRPRRGKPVVR